MILIWECISVWNVTFHFFLSTKTNRRHDTNHTKWQRHSVSYDHEIWQPVKPTFFIIWHVHQFWKSAHSACCRAWAAATLPREDLSEFQCSMCWSQSFQFRKQKSTCTVNIRLCSRQSWYCNLFLRSSTLYGSSKHQAVHLLLLFQVSSNLRLCDIFPNLFLPSWSWSPCLVLLFILMFKTFFGILSSFILKTFPSHLSLSFVTVNFQSAYYLFLILSFLFPSTVLKISSLSRNHVVTFWYIYIHA